MKTVYAQDWVTTLHGEASDDGWMDPTVALVGRTFFVAGDDEEAEATFATMLDVDFFKLSHREPLMSASDGDVLFSQIWVVRPDIMGRPPCLVELERLDDIEDELGEWNFEKIEATTRARRLS